MSVYGYMRVSTIGQLKGNSIEEQKNLLEANGATHFYQDDYTGTVIQELLKHKVKVQSQIEDYTLLEEKLRNHCCSFKFICDIIYITRN